MSEQEGKAGIVALEAPTTLRPDQNFFDQEPFKTAIDTVAERHQGTDISKVRGLVLKTRAIPQDSDKDKIERALRNVLLFKKMRETEISVILEVLKELDAYPYWHEYVLVKFSDFIYNPENGDVKASKTVAKLTPNSFPDNYSSWIRRRLSRREDPKLFGLDQIFDKSSYRNTPLLTHSRARSRRATLRH